ncbi:MAG TPA: Ig-like domain-containing protein, partial [Dehalococcoidia bacterium]|nr:Ig-like domain-containing protein [Dehalococcoidia bacterium]
MMHRAGNLPSAIRATLRPLTLFALLGAASALGMPASALGAGPAATSITLSLPSTAVIGAEVNVTARLTSNGAPVTSRLLELVLDGTTLRTGSVDANGTAVMPIKTGELVRAHQATVTVRFSGSSSLAPSAQSAVLTVRPARLTIHTIPVVNGIPIRVGTLQSVTVNGAAAFEIPKLGSYAVVPDIAAASKSAMRADFVRWGDNVYTPDRDLIVAGDTDLWLGLHTAYRGSFRFVNQAGALIDPALIQSVTLTSTSGSQLVLRQYQDVWLEAGTAVKQLDTLAESPRSWRVLDVEMAGTNVVNRGQQRVDPAPDAVWTVTLLLYDLHVEGHDAIFGNALSGTLDLNFPDGTTRTVKLSGPNASADFKQLPRGSFTLRLSGAGLGAPTPVVLSSSQSAVIRVITYLDLGLFGTLILGAVAGLLWIGRRDQVLHVGQRFGLGLRFAGAATRGKARMVRVAAADGGRRVVSGSGQTTAGVRHSLIRRWAKVRTDIAGVGAALAHEGRRVGHWLRFSSPLRRLFGAAPTAATRGWIGAVRSMRSSLRRQDLAGTQGGRRSQLDGSLEASVSHASAPAPAHFVEPVPAASNFNSSPSSTEPSGALAASAHSPTAKTSS